MRWSRREFLASTAAFAALPGTVRAEEGLRLGRIAAAHGVAFGSAFDREVLSDPEWAGVLTDQARIGAIENSLKFDWLRPHGPEADFTAADEVVNFGLNAGLALRGTALIWNDWLPDWLRWTRASERLSVMERHIDEVVGRYAGRVASWDVVNEPFFPIQGREGGYRKGLWLDAIGPDYIALAFRRAAAADPDAELVLNEAFCEQDDAWGTSIRPLLLDCVRRLKDDGVPLHAVGLQGHLKPHLPHDYAAFAEWLSELAGLGVTLKITELDVDDSKLPADITERDAAVAETLSAFLEPVMKVQAVREVVCWQLSDRYSWYAGAGYYNDGRMARSHLLDAEMRPKSAAFAVARRLAAREAHP